MEVSVNGVAISPGEIEAEAQNHPAPVLEQALAAAAHALVIRQLLLQRACALKLAPMPEQDGAGRRETDEEALVRQVLDREIRVPNADEESCRRYYENNRGRFRSPALYQASHILFAAAAGDEPARDEALARAERTLALLASKPGTFNDLAREFSDCPSGRDGGSLGQVAGGEIVPEVETFLAALEDGQLCPVPVTSRYGVHVLRLERRIKEQPLPFEAVHARIADYLEEAGWRRAVAQYVQILAGQSDIRGATIAGAATPLVR